MANLRVQHCNMSLFNPIPRLLVVVLLVMSQNVFAQENGRKRTKAMDSAPSTAREQVEVAAQVAPAARPPAVWLDIYLLERAARYSKEGRILSDKDNQELLEVLDQMGDYCAGSEAHAYAQWVHYGFQPEHYTEYKQLAVLGTQSQAFLQHAAMADLTHGTLNNNADLRSKATVALTDLAAFSLGNLEFHRNALNSALPGGTIITNGNEDTFPLLMAQAQGLRTDVQVIQLDWLRNDTFRKTVFASFNIPEKRLNEPADGRLKLLLKHSSNKQIYLSTTLPKHALQKFDGALYPEGVLLRYAETNTVDNLAQTITWWENKATTDHLTGHDPICRNYLIALAVLNNHYLATGQNDKAAETQRLLSLLTPHEPDKRKVKQVSTF